MNVSISSVCSDGTIYCQLPSRGLAKLTEILEKIETYFHSQVDYMPHLIFQHLLWELECFLLIAFGNKCFEETFQFLAPICYFTVSARLTQLNFLPGYYIFLRLIVKTPHV